MESDDTGINNDEKNKNGNERSEPIGHLLIAAGPSS